MLLYLIRHGESVGNLNHLMFGHSDHPLTENGILQAEDVRKKLQDVSVAHCYSSTLKRASHTANICFGEKSVPITYTNALCEQYMGSWEDMTFDELKEKYPDELYAMMTDWTENPPVGGETFDEMHARVAACIDEIISRGEDAAIVAHNGPLSMIVTYLLGLEKKSVENFYFLHGCYTVISINDGYMKKHNSLRCFNK